MAIEVSITLVGPGADVDVKLLQDDSMANRTRKMIVFEVVLMFHLPCIQNANRWNTRLR
jgi:hypothetical protein